MCINDALIFHRLSLSGCCRHLALGNARGPLQLVLDGVPAPLKNRHLIGPFIYETIRRLSCRWRSRTAVATASQYSFYFQMKRI